MISKAVNRPLNYRPPHGRFERFVCGVLFRSMLRSGRISIDLGETSDKDYPDAEFVVAPPRLLTILRLLTGPDFWVGESFIEGHWYLTKGKLSDFLDAIEREAKAPYKAYYDFLCSIRGLRYFLRQIIFNKHYTRQVRHHYDIDSRIFEMILDEEMLYTCAFFSDETDSLALAQQNKIATTIRRMALSSGPTHVLDIGCGWGAMARAVARKHSQAKVCGLSISVGQINWAKRRDREILSSDEADRIEYRLEDYVDHEAHDCYDAVSVIGMIEHVGPGGFAEFFGKVHGFLKPGGTAIVHTIVSPLSALPTNRWIDRHIFTGGYAPSISELVAGAEKLPFRITGVHVHEPSHYRRTIECWLANFTDNVAMIEQYLQAIKYNETEVGVFVRTWTFYLSAVRNMFSDDSGRSHQVVQLTIKKLDLDEAPKHEANAQTHGEHRRLG